MPVQYPLPSFYAKLRVWINYEGLTIARLLTQLVDSEQDAKDKKAIYARWHRYLNNDGLNTLELFDAGLKTLGYELKIVRLEEKSPNAR